MTNVAHTLTAKSDQLNACDLVGGAITVKILSALVKKGLDQPITIGIDGGYQPWKPCLGMRRALARIWELDSEKWIGQSLTLYCDDSAKWGGEAVGGIRISHATGISEQQRIPMRLSKSKVVIHIINPLIITAENAGLLAAEPYLAAIRAATTKDLLKAAYSEACEWRVSTSASVSVKQAIVEATNKRKTELESAAQATQENEDVNSNGNPGE